MRPIFLAEATTVAGMSTIAFVRSGQEQFTAPMALAIVCGLTFGVIVTLVMLACLYAMLDDVVHYFSGPGDVPRVRRATSATGGNAAGGATARCCALRPGAVFATL